MTDHLTLTCHAKVNLFLRVLSRDDDGYHSLETLFCRIALHDTLEIRRIESGISLHVEGAELGTPESNLAWRAADAVLSATGRHFGVAMHLTKRIPLGAGLGGGSSDAAQALLGVNRLADNRVPTAELLNLGARLGADVPFFVSEAPSALAWGRGQRMLRLAGLPERPALLLVPAFSVSTAEAYRWLDQARQRSGARGGITLEANHLNDWSAVARMAGNDFESAVFGEHPTLKTAFEALAATRPLLCRMTGSGSTLFTVYRNPADLDDAISQLGGRYGAAISTTAGGVISSSPDAILRNNR